MGLPCRPGRLAVRFVVAALLGMAFWTILGGEPVWARAGGGDGGRPAVSPSPGPSVHLPSPAWKRKHYQNMSSETVFYLALILVGIVVFAYLAHWFYRLMGWLPDGAGKRAGRPGRRPGGRGPSEGRPPANTGMAGGRGGTEGGRHARESPIPDPPGEGVEEPPADDEGEAELRRRDPGWNRRGFLEWARQVFLQVQDGYSRGDLAAMRHLLSAGMQDRFAAELRALAERGLYDRIDSMLVEKARIVQVFCDDDAELVEVEFHACTVNYRADLRTHALVEGSTAPERFIERWVFERRPAAAPSPAPGAGAWPWVLGDISVGDGADE